MTRGSSLITRWLVFERLNMCSQVSTPGWRRYLMAPISPSAPVCLAPAEKDGSCSGFSLRGMLCSLSASVLPLLSVQRNLKSTYRHLVKR